MPLTQVRRATHGGSEEHNYFHALLSAISTSTHARRVARNANPDFFKKHIQILPLKGPFSSTMTYIKLYYYIIDILIMFLFPKYKTCK